MPKSQKNTPSVYSFDQHPEHKAQLGAWAEKWTANALSTEPANQPVMVDAINGLYDAADLARPLCITFVQSPLAMAVAGGVAAGVWWLRDNPEQQAALFGRRLSEADLLGAVGPACQYAVAVGMGEPAPFDLSDAATYAATRAATDAATRAATRAATLVAFLVRCTGTSYQMRDGGSDWSSWCSYLSFFDRVAGIDLPVYEKWRHYEAAALNGGQRVMHPKFCIVSDRHTEIHIDANNNLHHDTSPAKTYADGWSMNYWHGIAVPKDFYTWDVERAISERNSEIRRCAIERLGWGAILDRLILVAEAPDPGNFPHTIRLYDLPSDLKDMYDEPARILVVHNASLDKGGHRRTFGLPVPATHTDPVAAAADLFGIPVAAYRQLARAS